MFEVVLAWRILNKGGIVEGFYFILISLAYAFIPCASIAREIYQNHQTQALVIKYECLKNGRMIVSASMVFVVCTNAY